MTNDDEEILGELLLKWEELREGGQDVTASALCQDHPQLSEELARRIDALKTVSWLDKPLDPGGDTSDLQSSFPTESKTLLGRYRLDELIATGGFAQVWRGYDQELQRIVAVKVPKPNRLESTDAFMAEARRVARLKHPGIVPVFDVGCDGESCFIVSEFVEGGSMGDHLSRNPPAQQQAIRWIAEIADAIEYAHLHGVIHRDIKPANILIDHHGRALLADFGIAQSASRAGQEALSLGTLRYMSPEQLEGKPVDPRADIFSLGVVLHEALTGKLPYSSAEPNVLRREIVTGAKVGIGLPAELKRICRKALELAPHHRYSSAAQLAAELRRYLGTAEKSQSAWTMFNILALTIVVCGLIYIWTTFEGTTNKERPSVELSAPLKIASDRSKEKSLTAGELIAQGTAMFNQNHYKRAAGKFTEALRLDPKNAEAYHKRGGCLFNDGEFKLSLADFSKAIDLEPQNAEFLKHRAMAFASLRQFDPALADMDQALVLPLTDSLSYREAIAIIYSNRAAERFNAKRFSEAADDVSQAIKHFPQGNVYYHQRGSCYFNMKQYQKAMDDFTEAIRREPTKAAHHLHRGYCLQALGREQEASVDFEKAKSLGNAP